MNPVRPDAARAPNLAQQIDQRHSHIRTLDRLGRLSPMERWAFDLAPLPAATDTNGEGHPHD
ncbi:hypothetical protein [uncultured Brevundimonas sp.]|uniref:hypothetical protein n=1 Tax=uncultured Brevundimonas sp. TaxID=213418 RepID=UPI00262CDFA8|nr:hypothetical protein [uncultured Brevundimonas sp.]